MGRTTVENCLKIVPNHFDLAILTAERASQLMFSNYDPKNKPTVTALNEIEEGRIVKPDDLLKKELEPSQGEHLLLIDSIDQI